MSGWLKGAALGLSLALAATTGWAGAWQVDAERTRIGFEYLRDGAPAKGIFETFEGTGQFDASNPAGATMVLKIKTRSIDLYDRLASGFATSAEWFDSKNHPYVTYELNALSPLGDNLYEAKGVLTIRGKSKPITTTIKLIIDDKVALAQGDLSIHRADYLLGIGPGAAFVEIGPDVTVTFNLVATPVN